MTADELPTVWKRIYHEIVSGYIHLGGMAIDVAREKALRAVLAMMRAKEDCYVE